MIKFVGQVKGKPTLGLGLSHENLQRLKRGQPILLHLAEVGLPYDLQVFIFTGETEQAMYDLLKPGIDRDTKMHMTEPS